MREGCYKCIVPLGFGVGIYHRLSYGATETVAPYGFLTKQKNAIFMSMPMSIFMLMSLPMAMSKSMSVFNYMYISIFIYIRYGAMVEMVHFFLYGARDIPTSYIYEVVRKIKEPLT
jgi:hypothetical protein